MVAGIILLSQLWGQLPWARRLRSAIEPDTRDMEGVLQDDDLQVLEKRLEAGANPNAKDVFDQALLHWARSPRAVELMLAHGADPEGRDKDGDTVLMEAARAGNVETVKVMLAGGADVNAVNTEYGIDHTAMIDAVSSRNEEVQRLLLAAGAHDERVTAANGQPLPEGGGVPFEVCARYIAAIHRRDPRAMAELVTWQLPTEAPPGTESTTDWETLSSVRPLEPRFDGGHYNQTDATLTLSGLTPAGFEAVWNFQLRRVRPEQEPVPPEGKTRIDPLDAGPWRIVREDWIVD